MTEVKYLRSGDLSTIYGISQTQIRRRMKEKTFPEPDAVAPGIFLWKEQTIKKHIKKLPKEKHTPEMAPYLRD